jgi:hypothetical protein
MSAIRLLRRCDTLRSGNELGLETDEEAGLKPQEALEEAPVPARAVATDLGPFHNEFAVAGATT